MAKKIEEYSYDKFVDDALNNLSNMSLNVTKEQVKILLLDSRLQDFKFIREDKASWRGLILYIGR